MSDDGCGKNENKNERNETRRERSGYDDNTERMVMVREKNEKRVGGSASREAKSSKKSHV